VYTIALRDVLEQHPDWTWAAVEVVARASRDQGAPPAASRADGPSA